MTIAKRRIMMAICAAIIFIAGTFIAADWLVYYFCNIKHISGTCGFSVYQNISKFATTFLNGLLVWIIFKNGIDRKDTMLLSIAFGFALVADFFLKILFNADPENSSTYMVAGIVTFMIVQTFLILRHSRGVKKRFFCDGGVDKKNMFIELLWFAAIATVVSAIIFIKTGTMIPVIMAYACFLVTSVYFGWRTLTWGFYPAKNAWMIAIGMTLFLFCDINVGISSLPDTPIANNLVWMFYTPALMLLALSGYDWSNNRKQNNQN